jgi:DNA-binding transcriptional regulator/RsmH inhibitor MraZ
VQWECGVRLGRGMDGFVSHYTLRLDANGPISISAPFWAVLTRRRLEGLRCFPALDGLGLDGLWLDAAGPKFQIWEPARFRAQFSEAKGKLRALTKRLGFQRARGARE